jgi:hypothetical protein
MTNKPDILYSRSLGVLMLTETCANSIIVWERSACDEIRIVYFLVRTFAAITYFNRAVCVAKARGADIAWRPGLCV